MINFYLGAKVTSRGLQWEAVKKSDEDWYRCTARSGHHIPTHSPWAYVKVLGR